VVGRLGSCGDAAAARLEQTGPAGGIFSDERVPQEAGHSLGVYLPVRYSPALDGTGDALGAHGRPVSPSRCHVGETRRRDRNLRGHGSGPTSTAAMESARYGNATCRPLETQDVTRWD